MKRPRVLDLFSVDQKTEIPLSAQISKLVFADAGFRGENHILGPLRAALGDFLRDHLKNIRNSFCASCGVEPSA